MALFLKNILVLDQTFDKLLPHIVSIINPIGHYKTNPEERFTFDQVQSMA